MTGTRRRILQDAAVALLFGVIATVAALIYGTSVLDALGWALIVYTVVVTALALIDHPAAVPQFGGTLPEAPVSYPGCPFCRRIDYGDYVCSTVGHGILAFEPLNPVVPGHLLVVPARHVVDAKEDPALTGAVFRYAAELATPPFNLITSAGAAATQSVYHLHAHIVPRQEGDGLALPWTGQQQPGRTTKLATDENGITVHCGRPATCPNGPGDHELNHFTCQPDRRRP